MKKPITYDFLTIALHWITAFATLGLFALGVWMVDLGYYDSWYNRAPDLHRSFGILLTILVVARILWRMTVIFPPSLPNQKRWEKIAAKITHVMLYLLLLIIGVSGYFISSAEGQAVAVFNWFSIPSIISTIENLEDSSGVIHEWAAYAMIALTTLHALAAVKHHYIDHDNTLTRMLGINRRVSSKP